MKDLPDSINLRPDDRILLIHLRAMGDALLTTPLIRTMKNSLPYVNIDVLTEAFPAQALFNNPYLGEIHISPAQGAVLTRYIKLIQKLRLRKYRLAIDLLSTPGSALLTRLINARDRVGYKLRYRSWAYTLPVERRIDPIYNPLTKFDLVEYLHIDPTDLTLDIFPTSDDVTVAEQYRKAKAIGDGSKQVIAFAPWSKRAWRRWSIEAWISTMRECSRNSDIVWILFASEHERPLLHTIEDTENLRICWAGLESIGQVAALMKGCGLFVGADNGLKHVAVASGIPTITVYSGSDPQVWNPPHDNRHAAIVVNDPSDFSSGAIQSVADRIKSELKTSR